jgi:diguanylate cyclase (GGDEF)-like protein/PAS domain S-box-containing protein
MLNSRKARFLVAGVGTACVMLGFEAAKQTIQPAIGIWTSHFATIAFTTIVAVGLSLLLWTREERSRRELSAERKERLRTDGKSRSESVAREQIETELRQSEDHMRMAIEAARVGFFDWDVTHDAQVWSTAAKELLGLSPDSPANFTVLMDAVHLEDRESLSRIIASVTPQKPDFIHEHRACWRDGTVHWIWIKGWGFFDQEERLVKICGIAMGIDERKRAEEQFRLHAAAMEEAANGIVITDNKGTILWVNPAFTQMTGYSPDEAIGKNPRLLQSGKHDAAFYTALWNTIAAGAVWRGEIINRKKDGSLYTEEMTIAPVRSDVGAITHFVAIKQDITRRKLSEQALQKAEEMYRSIFENAILGIFQTTTDGRFLSVNPALAKMAGYDSPPKFLSSVHRTSEVYVDQGRREELLKLLETQKMVLDFEIDLQGKDGKKRTVSLNVRATANREGTNLCYEGTAQDITERKAAEARVQFLAYHDALTSLPNRALFEDRLVKALANARRREEQVAVLWLGLDNFKTINDSLGHSVGDLLLKQVGERLQKHVREQDTLANVGGDEFIFALIKPGHVSRTAAAVDRNRRAVSAEFVVQDHVINLTCSIGISLFPDHGADSEALLKTAAAAMYCAKENGRNNFQFFTPELNARALERLALENGLRVALEKRELFLLFEPQVEIATGRITGAEALLRWRHPELGLVAPNKFIPVAENSGLIIPIGEWVLKTACAQARRWQDLGLPVLPIAVNVSAVQLRQQRFLRVIRRVLDETGLAPRYLELELTEGMLVSNTGRTLPMLQELAQMGVRLSIDDFGTGYSNLGYLKDLPIHKLKIDRSFVRTMTLNPRDAAIAAIVISIGDSLNLKVLAEGVETGEQLAFLRAHNCDEAQGYYFSRPLTGDEFADEVRSTAFL